MEIILRKLSKLETLTVVANPAITLEPQIEKLYECGWFLCKKVTSLGNGETYGNLIEYTLRDNNVKKECVLVSNTITACTKCKKKYEQ